MEKLCQRFPLISQKIINQVDNETLTNFKDGGRYTNDFLKKERFYWIRIIEKYNCLTGDLQGVWKKVISKTPVEIVKELAVEDYCFYRTMSRRLEWHPLFIGAASGSVNLCDHIHNSKSWGCQRSNIIGSRCVWLSQNDSTCQSCRYGRYTPARLSLPQACFMK